MAFHFIFNGLTIPNYLAFLKFFKTISWSFCMSNTLNGQLVRASYRRLLVFYSLRARWIVINRISRIIWLFYSNPYLEKTLVFFCQIRDLFHRGQIQFIVSTRLMANSSCTRKGRGNVERLLLFLGHELYSRKWSLCILTISFKFQILYRVRSDGGLLGACVFWHRHL